MQNFPLLSRMLTHVCTLFRLHSGADNQATVVTIYWVCTVVLMGTFSVPRGPGMILVTLLQHADVSLTCRQQFDKLPSYVWPAQFVLSDPCCDCKVAYNSQ